MGKGTVHITLRVPKHVADELEHEAERLNMPVSHLYNSILQKWADWDMDAQKMGLVPAPKEILAYIISGMGEAEIQNVISKSMEFFKDAVIMMEGSYDLKRCIVTLERYMRSTGIWCLTTPWMETCTTLPSNTAWGYHGPYSSD